MSKKWTEAQREAIFTQKCNLLVAAGAGTGKTAVLVERIIQKITNTDEDVDIDRLLVVTFTNAAASEMKERIGEALSRLLEMNCNSKNLQKQLALLNQSNIMTIHSFCLKIIKSNFHLIDLDPGFRVCDNTEAILLKQDALQEILEEKYQDAESEFLKLVDSFRDKNDIRLQNMIISLYEFSRSNPWPKKWLEEAAEDFNVGENFNFEDTLWAKMLIHNLNVEVGGYRDKMENALEIIKSTIGLEHYICPFEDDIKSIDKILQTNSWNEMKKEFMKLKFHKLPGKKTGDDIESIKKSVRDIKDEVKKKLNDIRESIFLNSDNLVKDMKKVYPRINCLVTLVMDFSSRYYDKKRERGVLDFSDIEHFCLDILTDMDDMGHKIPSQVALEYRKYFQEIFIDEYQDSNEVQEVIINMISRKDQDANLFMVGDVKQSIYRFRQSKPELFLQKYDAYSERKGSRNRKIKLSENFRSRKEIIDGVNYLFKQIMCREVGELDYNDDECLISSAQYKDCSGKSGGAIEIYMADKKEAESGLELDNEEMLDNIQVEARMVAGKINELVNPKSVEGRFKVYDSKMDCYRNVMYRDIVILMRATRNWASTFVEQLNDFGIPVFADTSTGYFDTVEIKTVVSLLEIIDNPIQDIPLIAVLRSPIETFLPEELMDLRMVNREAPFYEVLKAVAEESTNSKYSLEGIDDVLKCKVVKFLKRLENWRRKVIYMPIDEFIWHLYTETGYYGFVGAMSGGVQRQANLRMLFERAKQYEKSSYKGLFNFINFINKLKSSSGDLGSAKVLGENEDVVRIMSIHKSKGLEFPIVILSGAGKNFNLIDINRSLLFHDKLGFGPDCIDIERHISYPTIMKQVLKRKLKIETLSEEMRILYVAFTRAKEKLIITGMVRDIEKTAKKWCEYASYSKSKISEYALMNAKNFLDWIGPAIARHPFGKPIRDIAGSQNNSNWIVKEDESIWKMYIKGMDSFIKGISTGEVRGDDITEWIKNLDKISCKKTCAKEVNKRLNWKYKYEKASEIPAKFSVSELKRRFNLIDREDSVEFIEPVYLKKPLFLKGSRGLTAAEKGTVMHLAMQHIDIKKVNSYSEIEEQIRKLVLEEFITEEEAKSISIQKILKFFNSSIGERMKRAENLYREVPFYMEVGSSEIYKELPSKIYDNEKVLVQGVIDCYFQEKDELVLLDYKTDYVESLENMREKYKIQIYYYARALEKLTGKKVKNKYLYLFYNDNILEI
ncbi:helicase-exonuclease AddAB subunit AddA [Clostridium sp. WLY-B-L2]|uniref:ATP-dependent helicase/nuclease subunit A n=1 Tax=Clostridium aromativorans TaxID=2836848 RepID=A0ABS8N5F0_9CLOT|nr:helicase-exonuclease AddAB subunit AddA [Clostridium aromativorans]MCC9295041.1 helicase-exonuclease AddAB subunit AddA [Clostridium aromativorans]CAB1251134.1 ATP-dependent helicase/nuclease subunit A [Clostridiaceae bacterium BL-3]